MLQQMCAQEIAPKCHLPAGVARVMANTKSLNWLGFTVLHEGARYTDESNKKRTYNCQKN